MPPIVRTLLCLLPMLVASIAATAAESLAGTRLSMVEPPAPAYQTQDTTSPWADLDPGRLDLRSASALVVDAEGRELFSRNADQAAPIASITKLMTAMVVLDAEVDMEQIITISGQDRDLHKLTGSRLRYGEASLSRRELLLIALLASENAAAAALGRTTFAGGSAEFVRAMNRKAGELGMEDSRFVDPTGLYAENRASPRDLLKLTQAAYEYPLIRQASTTRNLEVRPYPRRGPLVYRNTNRLLKNDAWNIELSKTGFIREAGRCLVMRAEVSGHGLYIVLLNSVGKLTPFGDSNRLRKWLQTELIQG